MEKPWIHKYKPVKASDVYGQDEAVKKLKDFTTNYPKQKKKAVLLIGPTGTGKSSVATALASDMNLEIVEVNASDFRTEEQINLKVGNALKQRSLFSIGKLILIDDLDGIAGNYDRGGLNAIAKLIENSTFPIIMTSNDPSDSKFSAVKSLSLQIQFTNLAVEPLFNLLNKICKSEDIEVSEETLRSLARRSGGDARAAINDLQSLGQDKSIKKEDLETLSTRDRKDEISNALTKVFKTTNPEIALSAFDDVNEDIDECIMWLDENLPNEYTNPKDLMEAYDMLSRADVFRGRIRRRQNWHFMTYVSQLSTAGVAVSKQERYKSAPNYKRSMRPLKIWQANMKYTKRKVVAAKWAAKTHTSVKYAIQNIHYLQAMLRDKKTKDKIIEELDLEKDEVDWLVA